MKKMLNEWRNEVQRSTYKGFCIFVWIVAICGFVGMIKNMSGSSDRKNIDYYLESSANSTYRYGSGSGISTGGQSISYYSSRSGTGSGSKKKSYSSGTTKKKSSTSQSKQSTKKYASKKKTAKQKAYDDFMDDALEDYLSCVDSYEEYEEAEEFFDEGWLTPDERAELDRLMDAYED